MTDSVPEGRCPNCGEDEMDGSKCRYCGYHDYNCGVCDDCKESEDVD